MRKLSRTILLVSVCAVAGCSATTLARGDQSAGPDTRGSQSCNCTGPGASGAADSPWAIRRAGATERFWKHWGDGKAELSGYRIVTLRYGQKRQGYATLIYVTEALDRTTLIKDDHEEVPAERRLHVLKLNQMLAFNTGIYPYSVMTSVFAPVADHGLPRFTPAKVAFSAQEWCGHVYQQVRPGKASLWSSVRSYFASEGDVDRERELPVGALYEDALLIQLRGLDGPFNGGKPWSGHLVPSLWRTRKAHVALAAVPATIEVADAVRAGKPVLRYTLVFSGVSKSYDVEKAFPRRVLGWVESDGEEASLIKSARLPYWQLNNVGDESYRQQLGLP